VLQHNGTYVPLSWGAHNAGYVAGLALGLLASGSFSEVLSLKMKHSSLNELMDAFGWSNEFPYASDVGSSVGVSNSHVWTTIDGRRVDLKVVGLNWICGVSWSGGRRRRKVRQIKKRLVELLALALDPSARKMLESIKHSSHAVIEDGLLVGTGGLVYSCPGEPPPAGTVVTLAETLARMASKIETTLDTST